MIRALCIAVVAACLAACASAPLRTPEPPVPWPERRAALQAQEAFALSGRVAVSTPANGFNASLRWRQAGEVSEVSLDGPLGVGGAEIELRGDDLDLRTSRGEHLEGEAAHEALLREVGFPLPLAALRYWLRGVPAPGAAADEVLDEARQRLTRLVQAGWEIDYAAYLDSTARSAGDMALPRRLEVRHGETRVRLVIDRWLP